MRPWAWHKTSKQHTFVVDGLPPTCQLMENHEGDLELRMHFDDGSQKLIIARGDRSTVLAAINGLYESVAQLTLK